VPSQHVKRISVNKRRRENSSTEIVTRALVGLYVLERAGAASRITNFGKAGVKAQSGVAVGTPSGGSPGLADIRTIVP